MSLLEEIKYLSRIHARRPNKKLSQNFLVDELVYDTIIDTAELKKHEAVLEIGPGWGMLTGKLVAQVKKVLAVEADSGFIDHLQGLAALQSPSSLIIKPADILRVKNEEIAEILGQPYKVVANLPYHITSAVIEKFLAYEPRPALLVLLVQKEVAERLCATPTSRGEGMSVLSVATQFYAEPEYVATVPAGCFWPSPKVDSAIVKLKVKKDLPAVPEKAFFRLVKIGFAARRKQLHNNLSAGLQLPTEAVKTALKSLNLAENCRAQDLSLENWLTLFVKLS